MPDAAATALIAAAGSGERLGAGGPKALVELAGRPLVCWCLDAFAAAAAVGRAVLAVPAGHEQDFEALAAPGLELIVVTGGTSRSESVAAGLEALADDSELVVVHDAARPLVDAQLIDAVVAGLVAAPDAAGVIAATPITDTVKRARGGADAPAIMRTEDRSELWAAQTPQAFRAQALRAALETAGDRLVTATDDAMLVEEAGGTVLIEPAPASNLKVTRPLDLRVAEFLLRER